MVRRNGDMLKLKGKQIRAQRRIRREVRKSSSQERALTIEESQAERAAKW